MRRHNRDLGVYLGWMIRATSFRLPIAMIPLGVEYAIGASMGYRYASFTIAMLSAGEIVTIALLVGPPGRWVRHRSNRSVFILLGVVDLILAGAALSTDFAWVAPIAALVGGVLSSLASGRLRHNLTRALSNESLQRYLSWDAVTLEVVWLISPLVLTLEVALSLTPILLFTPGIIACLTPLFFSKEPADATIERPKAHSLGIGMWLWVMSAAEGMVEGGLIVAVVALSAQRVHTTAVAGLILGSLSTGSILGGIAYSHLGTTHPSPRPARRLAALMFALAISLVLLVLLGHSTFTLVILGGVLGIFVAPINGLRSYAVTTIFPVTDHSNAFSALWSTYSVGAVIAAIAYSIVGSGKHAGNFLVVTAIVATITSTLAVIASSRQNALKLGVDISDQLS
ncbi:MAG: hypothetical protein ACYDHP_02415 [Ferrimicrobium sp.]